MWPWARRRSATRMPLASLSKAILACASPPDRPRQAFLRTRAAVAAWRALSRARHDACRSASVCRWTISQLLVHRAGSAQGGMRRPLVATCVAYGQRTAFDTQLNGCCPAGLASAPAAQHLFQTRATWSWASVIEEASGRDYESYCKERYWFRWAPQTRPSIRRGASWRATAAGACRSPTTGRFYQAFALGNPSAGPVSRA